MAITYPLTPPDTIARSIRFTPISIVAASTSPFTLEQEIFEHQGQMWRVAVQLPPMEKDEGEEWASFFLALNGILGTFILGDPVGQTPRGTMAGTPVIDGAGHQQSKVLPTKGWTPGATVIAGDYIELPQNRLHKIVTNTIADGGGLADLDIFPRVRDVLADGATIITENTTGIWRMTNDIPSWDIREGQIYGVAFEAREEI